MRCRGGGGVEEGAPDVDGVGDGAAGGRRHAAVVSPSVTLGIILIPDPISPTILAPSFLPPGLGPSDYADVMIGEAPPDHVNLPIIRTFGIGALTSRLDCASTSVANVADDASPVARALAPVASPPSVCPAVTVSSTITKGVTTSGRWSALRVDAVHRVTPARGRPDASVLRLAGGAPRGHPKVD